MPEGRFAGLREYTDHTARQPDFDTIRRRAGQVRRRRRHTVASVLAAVTAIVVGGVTVGVAPGDGRRVPDPSPTPTAGLNAGWPRWGPVTATGSDELYAVFERCRTCDPELYASGDAGGTWQRRVVPQAPGEDASRPVMLVPLGPGVLVWRDVVAVALPAPQTSAPAVGERSRQAVERLWVTVDGGRTWRRTAVDGQPVDAVPPGTRPVDCGLLGPESPCRIHAVDPVSGRFAPLAAQPTGLLFEPGWLTGNTDVPVGGRLWVPGLDPATGKPAVASSPDGGRTWRTHVFADGVAAVRTQGSTPTAYVPTVAAGAGATAYALTVRDDHGHDAYRTTDGGVTWQPVPGGALPEVPDAGYVAADGAHVVKTGQDFRASRDGGRYEPVTLAGYPAELRRLTQVTSQPAAGRYVVTSGSVLYVSDDGWAWWRGDMP